MRRNSVAAALLLAGLAAVPVLYARADQVKPGETAMSSLPVQAAPVVDGHRIQPKASAFAWPNKPDIDDADAKALDDLYRRQMAPH